MGIYKVPADLLKKIHKNLSSQEYELSRDWMNPSLSRDIKLAELNRLKSGIEYFLPDLAKKK